MNDGPRYRDAEWLREQYVEKKWSTYDIAEECDCANSTVRKWMDKHNIGRRRDGPQVEFERLRDEEWVREQYVENGKTIADIAEICGCTDAAVSKSLKRLEIEAERPVTDERLRDAAWLREQHSDQKRSGVEIAQQLGCTASAVYSWLGKHGIETKNRYNGPTGSEHPHWKGGPAQYGPGWNESKRQAVRDRDDHTCQDSSCSVTQQDHLNEYGQKLHVHHLRKARDIEDPEQRNAKQNLITLCVDCHMRWEKIADAGLVPEVVPADD
jgi:transposase-like protein